MDAIETAKKLCKQKNYGKAQIVLKQYLFQQQKNAQAYYQMGVVLKKMREMEASISYLTICLEYDPNHREARELLVSILIYTEHYHQALEIAEEYLKINSNDFSMNFLVAKIEERLENFQRAKECLQKCLRIKPRQSACQELMKSIKYKVSRLKQLNEISTEELQRKIIELQEIHNQIKIQKSEEGLCVACCQFKACYAAKQCGHCCLCEECAKKLIKNYNSCPICRKSRINFIKIHIV